MFNLNKRIKIAPGIRVNLNKKGITSISVGGKGITKNISKKGTRTTLSIPKTGISFSDYQPTRKKHNNFQFNKGKWIFITAILIVLFFIISL